MFLNATLHQNYWPSSAVHISLLLFADRGQQSRTAGTVSGAGCDSYCHYHYHSCTTEPFVLLLCVRTQRSLAPPTPNDYIVRSMIIKDV